ncbi:MAG: M48 family metallopeptidase [Pseudomonadota bacterium]
MISFIGDSMINGYFIFVLATVLGFFLLDVVSRIMNLGSLKPELPTAFADVFDESAYAKSQDYTRDRTRFGLLDDTASLVILLAFWWLGGFGWLDDVVRGHTENQIIAGLLFIGALYLGSRVINMPFDLYGTFVIEERYGFNKTTIGTFVIDKVKGLLLSAVIGVPILALVLHLFDQFGSSAWLYGWIAVAAFSLLMMYLAPTYIMPLFNKFEPLEEGELKTAIREMSEKCQFPLTEVYEIDGSKRSTKANAFFTGLGKHKKIALYDTLIKNNGVGELVAVLAHEIGHFKKKHIYQSMVLSILQMGVLFFLLGLFLNNQGLFDAFGVEGVSVYGSLVFFMFLFEPVSKLLSILMMILSRKNEYEADAYAAEVTGRPEDLISGLKKLSKDNLANLTPHPFFVFLNYSHPPMLKRIAALEALR